MVAAETKPASANSSPQLDDVPATELGYFQDMFALQSKAAFLALVRVRISPPSYLLGFQH